MNFFIMLYIFIFTIFTHQIFAEDVLLNSENCKYDLYGSFTPDDEIENLTKGKSYLVCTPQGDLAKKISKHDISSKNLDFSIIKTSSRVHTKTTSQANVPNLLILSNKSEGINVRFILAQGKLPIEINESSGNSFTFPPQETPECSIVQKETTPEIPKQNISDVINASKEFKLGNTGIRRLVFSYDDKCYFGGYGPVDENGKITYVDCIEKEDARHFRELTGAVALGAGVIKSAQPELYNVGAATKVIGSNTFDVVRISRNPESDFDIFDVAKGDQILVIDYCDKYFYISENNGPCW